MVNSGLRSAYPTADAPAPRCRPGTIERIFATKAALTNQAVEVGGPRSHFGPADSWVIKNPGGNSCRGGLRHWANLRLYSPFVVTLRISVRRNKNLKKTLFAGDKACRSQ
jgi:hypothetical protein